LDFLGSSFLNLFFYFISQVEGLTLHSLKFCSSFSNVTFFVAIKFNKFWYCMKLYKDIGILKEFCWLHQSISKYNPFLLFTGSAQTSTITLFSLLVTDQIFLTTHFVPLCRTPLLGFGPMLSFWANIYKGTPKLSATGTFQFLSLKVCSRH
jgi:hypothetical protein